MSTDYAYANAHNPLIVDAVWSTGVDFQWFAVPSFSCFIVFWLTRDLIKGLLFDRTSLPTRFPDTLGRMSAYQREAFVMWIMQPLFGTIGVAIMLSFSSDVLIYGTFQTSLLTDDPDVYLDRPLMWSEALKNALTVWRWAFQPFVLLYLYEIVTVSPARAHTLSHHLLTFHHLLVILIAGWIFKSFQETLNPVWAQMGWVLYLHMTLEQPSWLALIAYRLKARGYALWLLVATVIEIILRLVLWGLALYVYAKLCWFPCGLTHFEGVFQVAFPLCAMLMMAAQIQIIRIHLTMATGRRSSHTDTTQCNTASMSSASLREPTTDAEIVLRTTPISSGDVAADTKTKPPSPREPATERTAARDKTTPPCASVSEMAIIEVGSPDSVNADASSSPTLAPPCPQRPQPEKDANQAAGHLESGVPFAKSPVAATEVPPMLLAIFVLIVFGLIFGAEIIRPTSGWMRVSCTRVAVVGGGAAGLGASHALNRDGRFSVTLLERRGRLGGNAYSITHQGNSLDLAVHYFSGYNNVENVLSDIGIELRDEYSGISVLENSTDGTLRSFTNYMAAEGIPAVDYRAEMERLSKLLRRIKNTWSEADLMRVTLKAFFVSNNFTSEFQEALSYSLHRAASATGSAKELDMPVGLFAYIDELVRLSTSSRQRQYKNVVRGGIYSYPHRFEQLFAAAGSKVTLKLGAYPVAVKHSAYGRVKLLIEGGDGPEGSGGQWLEFDQVIFATPKDEALRVLTHPNSSPLPAERVYRRVLENKYNNFGTFAHTDHAYVERRFASLRDSRGCWRLEDTTAYVAKNSPQPWAMAVRTPTGISFYDQCLRNLSGLVFLQSYLDGNDASDDLGGVDRSKILEQVTWRHPTHTLAFYQGSRAGHAIQGVNRLWFAGAEAAALNLHEPAMTSGLVIANSLGAAYPFDGHDGARGFFLKMREWLLFGNPYTVAATGRKQTAARRCARC